MVLHNPGNWHWVDKDVRDWAKQYFDKKLVGVAAEDKGTSVHIEKVLSIEGDCDVSQRKGKIVTLYDLKIKLEYKGTNADGVEASGSVTVPEVAYDTEEDEYQFEISNYSDSAEKQAVRELVRAKITPQLRSLFGKFTGDMIAEHGKDIQHDAASDPRNKPSSSSSIPAPKTGSAKDVTKPVEVKHTKTTVVNTTTVKMAFEFRAAASDLYQIFVDPEKTKMFTRDVPSPFEPKEGGKFRLFNGNVEGVFKKLEEGKKIVQDWRLASWPQGHYSSLNLTFDEGSGFTTLRLDWEGVPLGQEEVAKQNFGEYYAKSIGNTFGYASSPSKIAPLKSKKRGRTHTNSTTAVQGGWWDMIQVAGPPVLSVGVVWLAIAAAVVYFRRPE
ncbi:hypothetical protein EX30DRAFT_342944 [Ascodesmis nigricans]|uniref:Activator of Hsp90 ATPase AHSA1-like N-terminal domain-containing protein n=1 Tax=Ascodesmis nigricans TaxID=341454 RepID=A0A4S2MNS0_9PEZI|nr:hypothetical protein EX30DRAFT_342944 [Ascodesmis nigricans]